MKINFTHFYFFFNVIIRLDYMHGPHDFSLELGQQR